MRLKSLLNLRWKKIIDCVDPFARSYDLNHHLVKVCKKILEGKFDDGLFILKEYHDNFKPKSSEQALGLNKSKHIFPIFEFPWGSFREKTVFKKDILESRFCGPSPQKLIDTEFKDLVELVKSIKNNGFSPIKHRSLVGRVDLIWNSSCVPIIIQGNHRLACLSAMEYNAVLTTTLTGYKSVIDRSKITTWVNVKSGLCNAQEAEQIFQTYFKNV